MHDRAIWTEVAQTDMACTDRTTMWHRYPLLCGLQGTLNGKYL